MSTDLPKNPSATFDFGQPTAAEWTNPDLTMRRTPPSATGEAATEVRRIAAHGTPLPEGLDLMGPLGMGGMGVVQLARQTHLGRLVAVKSVRPGVAFQSGRRRLLQEAWASASLEHPNVVPVYDVVSDEDGLPHVVLRRIQGLTWATFIARPELVRSQFGARDLLAWHLGVLQQVCHAVSFAHSQGILHRDLKPDNVMIGSFGEVYVLDWGLAVRFAGSDDGRLPLAKAETQLVGTPRYMAPEMAAKEGHKLGPATDVYLLGGLLFNVITGKGPHPGSDPRETVAAVSHFEAELPAGTPARLAGIVRRAMASAPEDRFECAEDFRLVLQMHLEERGADGLSREAREQLIALRAALRSPDIDPVALTALFATARFGFVQALRTWPDHPDATLGHRETLQLMARYELQRGQLAAGDLLLAELDLVPDELLALRAELAAEQTRAAARLASLEADRSATLGQRTRIFVLLLVVAVWTFWPLVLLGEEGQPSSLEDVAFQSIKLVLVTILVFWARDSLGQTRLNRSVAGSIVAVQATTILASLGSWLLGLTVGESLVLDLLIYACLAGLATATVSLAAAPSALGFALAFVAACLAPELVVPLTSVAVAFMGITFFAAWYPAARGTLLHRHAAAPAPDPGET